MALSLEERIEAIEARQRTYGMHDPDCPVRLTQIAQRTTDAYLVSPPCACWLTEKCTEPSVLESSSDV